MEFQQTKQQSMNIPDSKVHGANMGPTWVLLASDGPHVVPMNIAIWDNISYFTSFNYFRAQQIDPHRIQELTLVT